MTHGATLPEVNATPEVAALLAEACDASGGTAALEARVREERLDDLDLRASRPWRELSEEVREAYRAHDHVVLRGLPVTEDGASLLMAALAASSHFRSYRAGQIVKRFRMSPWTADLSHTTKEGDFHTDLNTEPEPPAVTVIQCQEADPGAPRYGVNRVARLEDLLRRLEEQKADQVLGFLQDTQVAMVNGSAQRWRGSIVEEGRIRYHPVTLRDAEQSSEVAAVLDEVLTEVHEAALAVSVPFDLRPGDVLLTSNRRALHYRGECSVAFTRYPTEYRSRSIFVLHQPHEPE